MLIEWLTFLLVMAVGQFAPGPDMVLLTRTALSNGRAAGWAMSAGIASGLIIHASIALSGVAKILSSGGLVSTLLSVAAAGYLFWLGWQLFVSARAGVVIDWGGSEKESNVGLWSCWRKGFLCNVLNPKVVIFLTGVVTPFLNGHDEKWWPWLLWVSTWLLGFVLWGMWSSVLQWGGVRRKYASLARWIDAAFSVLLWAMSVILLWRLV